MATPDFRVPSIGPKWQILCLKTINFRSVPTWGAHNRFDMTALRSGSVHSRQKKLRNSGKALLYFCSLLCHRLFAYETLCHRLFAYESPCTECRPCGVKARRGHLAHRAHKPPEGVGLPTFPINYAHGSALSKSIGKHTCPRHYPCRFIDFST